jgi:hemolysin activation/secretion protein
MTKKIFYFVDRNNRTHLLTLSIAFLTFAYQAGAIAMPKSSQSKLKLNTDEKTLYLAQNPSPVLPNRSQQNLSPIEPNQPETPKPLAPLPPSEDLLKNPSQPQPSPEKLPEFAGTIDVKGFKVVGSTVFSQETFDRLLKNYNNRPLTFAEILQAEAEVTKLYVNDGYINSGAIIPEQTLENGIVTIQAVEGTLEDIQVTVSGKLNPNYIRKRLAKSTGAPLNVKKLQEALQLLQLDPLVKNLSAELSVGARREEWLLAIEIDEAKTFRPRLFIDNSRTPSVGSFQRGIEINENNLTGNGDSINLAYKNTDGSNEIDGGYTIPINTDNGTLGIRYRNIDSDIIEEPFDRLNINSKTNTYELTYRQPILRSASPQATKELALGLTGSLQRSKTELDGDPFPLSVGAGNDGKTNVTALRFFQDFTQRTPQDVLVARSQFSLGLDAFDATKNSGDNPDSQFFAWRGQVQWLRQLAKNNTNLLLRSDIQLSTTDLVPLEQFGLGGIESVRGYRQDALLSDNGIFASAEVRIPVYTWQEAQGTLAFIPFLDVGTVWDNSNNENIDTSTLVSLGVGLQLSLSDRLSARLDWGIPLVDLDDSSKNTWQENGVYFSVQYFPF